ncbi:MAG: hypothetical protein XU13_C0010G0027 [Candidatus Rokubacteria bacterium CSP1-6]|nr:MAG: hypothetical protein XU13_C0010G0027 [Candidatus Rokubacteria bacterium CSP1-6]
MRRALAAAFALLAVALRPGTGESAASGPPLLAGARAVDVTPPTGVALAGYGGMGRRRLVPDLLNRHPYAFWFKPSRGVHDPIVARALVLQSGPRRVLWIAVDLIGPDPEMVSELRERLAAIGLRYDAVILAASHTHSGPGGFSRSRLFGFLALDSFVPAVRERILRGMTEAAWDADRAKVPARVGVGRGEVRDVIRSRVGLPLDPEVGVLKVVRTDGRPIALLWNYAIHGTLLGKQNLLLSGDVTGAASQELERALGVPALYTNGAVGDVSPALRGWPGVRQTADALAREVLATWRRTPVERESALRAVSDRLHLPPPRLSLRNCLGRWLPSGLTVGMGWGFPSEAELVGVAVGASAWVTVPGELQTRLGQAVKAEGRRLFGHAFIVGISNDYAGYFLAPEEYARPSYIACASLYGEAGGQLVAARATEILKKLREER